MTHSENNSCYLPHAQFSEVAADGFANAVQNVMPDEMRSEYDVSPLEASYTPSEYNRLPPLSSISSVSTDEPSHSRSFSTKPTYSSQSSVLSVDSQANLLQYGSESLPQNSLEDKKTPPAPPSAHFYGSAAGTTLAGPPTHDTRASTVSSSPLVNPRFEHMQDENGHHFILGREGKLTRCEDEVHTHTFVTNFSSEST